MGACCGSSPRDEQILKTTNMDELINVMKKKKSDLAIEKKQIQDNLKDPKKQITLVVLDPALPKEAKEKRLVYLDELSSCFGDCIEKMETIPKLPFGETKEYMLTIVNHHLITYDETCSYRKDLERFKQFAFQYESKK